MYDASSSKEKVVLVRNPNYFLKDSAGCSLPYLDTVVVQLMPSIEDGLSMFENGKIDLINTLPSLRVKDVVEKNIKEFVSHPPKSLLQREPEMLSQFYIFNTKQKPFDNVKVRQAINYAIDREKLVDNVLQGQAIGAAIYGITPNTFAGYNIKNIKGYDLNIEKAKQLLSEAGFPEGKGFPEVRILVNSGNSRNSSVAVELQKQLKANLNINVNFESLPNVQKYELQMHGKSDIYRDAWVADFSSPESFLSLFNGDGVPADSSMVSFPNTSRYQNATYDLYFKKGRDSNIKDTSYAYFMKAEQVLINDAVIIPLWYEGSYRLLTNNIKGLNLNAMRYYDLTKTYKVK
jgi:ABC-type oligopeptide transport system substrate-binding subunit